MTGRSGTSNRKRHQVCVRLDPAEMALLKAACARSGLSAAAELRAAFLARVPIPEKDAYLHHREDNPK